MTGYMDFVLDGPNGAGKTTIIKRLASKLQIHYGIPCGTVRDPGETPIGEELRLILKGQNNIDAHTQVLLYTVARRQLSLHRLHMPEKTILFDRWLPSTLVYQGLQGVSMDFIRTLNQQCIPIQMLDDHVFILMAKPEVLRERVRMQQHDPAGPDRFEIDNAFQEQIRTEYLRLADFLGWRVIWTDLWPLDKVVDDLAETITRIILTKG